MTTTTQADAATEPKKSTSEATRRVAVERPSVASGQRARVHQRGRAAGPRRAAAQAPPMPSGSVDQEQRAAAARARRRPSAGCCSRPARPSGSRPRSRSRGRPVPALAGRAPPARRAARRSGRAGPRRPSRCRCRAPSSRRRTTSLPSVTGPVWITPACGPVAGEERVLADDRAVADGEQVGAHGHGAGEDRDAPADLRAQRPQVERVERRAGEQDQRVRPDQRLDEPEPEVGQAPDRGSPRLPPADQHPLGHDRQQAQRDEAAAAEHDRPQVDVDQARAGRDPLEAARRRRARRRRSTRGRSGAAAPRRARTAACCPASLAARPGPPESSRRATDDRDCGGERTSVVARAPRPGR